MPGGRGTEVGPSGPFHRARDKRSEYAGQFQRPAGRYLPGTVLTGRNAISKLSTVMTAPVHTLRPRLSIPKPGFSPQRHNRHPRCPEGPELRAAGHGGFGFQATEGGEGFRSVMPSPWPSASVLRAGRSGTLVPGIQPRLAWLRESQHRLGQQPADAGSGCLTLSQRVRYLWHWLNQASTGPRRSRRSRMCRGLG